MANTGDKLVAMATVGLTAIGGGSGSTTYVAVGPTCGLAFVAPATGQVIVLFGTAGFNTGANDNKTSIEVRAGGVVGSGTVFTTVIDDNMVLFTGAATYRINSFVTVSGLTPGSTYNVQMLHRVSAGTGTWLYRSIAVVPQT